MARLLLKHVTCSVPGVQWNGENFEEIKEFCGNLAQAYLSPQGVLFVSGQDLDSVVHVGDWVIGGSVVPIDVCPADELPGKLIFFSKAEDGRMIEAGSINLALLGNNECNAILAWFGYPAEKGQE